MDKWKAEYEEKVLPIIQERCLDCHSGEKPDGEFNFEKYLDGMRQQKVETFGNVLLGAFD